LAENRRVTKTQELVYEMKVDQVMTRDVVTVRPDTPMSVMRDVFREKRISGAPVVEGCTPASRIPSSKPR
jgi:CBS domain-containing protein